MRVATLFAFVALSLALTGLGVLADSDMACPVCGMSVEDTSPFTYPWKGDQTTYFCSSGCVKAFTSDPAHYLKGTAQDNTVSHEHAAHAMPTMESPHIRDGAAPVTSPTCPVCGMAVPDAHADRVSIDGNQRVLTCSHAHAEKVLGAPSEYAAATGGNSPLPDPSGNPPGTKGGGGGGEPYCVSGSVMWPGFAWKNKVCTILLFESVRISSPGGLLVACILMMVLGTLVEAIHTFRKKVVVRNYLKAVVAERYRSAKSSFRGGHDATAMLLEPTIQQSDTPPAASPCCASKKDAAAAAAPPTPTPSCHAGNDTGRSGSSSGGCSASGNKGVTGAGSSSHSSRGLESGAGGGVDTVTYGDIGGSNLSRDIRTGGSPLAWRAANSVLFASAIGVGYLLMLAAMSYNLSIFFSVIAGLGIGHCVFIEPSDRADAETKEPCCG